MTLADFIDASPNGWGDPREALRHLCSLLIALHFLHEAGVVHGDLHPQNIMMEEKKLPDEEIAAKAEAKARQMTGITGEERSLTEEDRARLSDARTIARAHLTPEDQYEYIPRIIDFGLAFNVNDTENEDTGNDCSPTEKAERLSVNMGQLGTLLPILIFGLNGAKFLEIGHYMALYKLQTLWEEAAKKEISRIRNPQQQLALQVMSLKEQLAELNKHEPEKRWREGSSVFEKRKAQFQEKKHSLETQIATESTKYKRMHREDVQRCEARLEADLKARTDAARNQYVFRRFHAANDKMLTDTGKFYPEPVLVKLAQLTANCLSTDSGQIPTAAEAYKEITELFLFTNWSNTVDRKDQPSRAQRAARP
jgi:hypothetical protein